MKIEYRNRLPHIAPIGATFFVTFRLIDALPRSVIAALRQEMEAEIRILEQEKPANYKQLIRNAHKRYFGKYDHQLDTKPYGTCYLRQPAVSTIVEDKLKEWNGKYYQLQAYCIMPNHVHVLLNFAAQIKEEDEYRISMASTDYKQLDDVMQLIKGGSSYQINRLLERFGKFWAKDSYDHYVRNEREWGNIVRYILNNPVQAGLVKNWEDWRFSYCLEVGS